MAVLPGGLLVYAAGEAEPGTLHVRHLGRTLEVHALDLSRSPEDLLAQVRLLARRIQALAGEVRLQSRADEERGAAALQAS